VTILILTLAVFDARRSFDNVNKQEIFISLKFLVYFFFQYLTRAEWRDRIQTTSNQIFDLSDLSSAIQDEQKPR
jgi:hypothetical protein